MPIPAIAAAARPERHTFEHILVRHESKVQVIPLTDSIPPAS